MNFVSQVIHAGGVPIDYTGSYQWKNYDLTEDHSDSATGFTYEFIRISYFNKYIDNTTDPPKMVVEKDLNFWLGEKGDIVYVGMEGDGYDDFPHVVTIVAPVYDAEGNLIDFLINIDFEHGLEQHHRQDDADDTQGIGGGIAQRHRLVKVAGTVAHGLDDSLLGSTQSGRIGHGTAHHAHHVGNGEVAGNEVDGECHYHVEAHDEHGNAVELDALVLER